MFKRYELHNHTSESDAPVNCQGLIECMEADGVDCFALTDHNTISGHYKVRRLMAKRQTSMQCAYGMEYTTYFGHIVCPVLEAYVPWDGIDRHKPELLLKACKEAGGITGIAHPFSYGEPFAKGCRFEMKITDFSDVDYIEIVNNPEPIHSVNGPAIRWWEQLVLDGVRISACAGMDLHKRTDAMANKFATYAQGQEGGDAILELRKALAAQRTWVSRGILLTWRIEAGSVHFALCDVKKPGFVYPSKYTMVLKGREGERTFDMTSGALTMPLSALADVEIPKLYGESLDLADLVCVAPVIRK